MRRLFLVLLCVCLVSITGCESNKTRVAEGAVIGGLAGGALGGIIGHQGGHGGEGAGIGIAAGALTGALIGSQINKPQKEGQGQNITESTQASQETQSVSGQLSIEQVVEMTKQGAKDDEIIAKIKSTNSQFNLSAEGVNYLKQQGVSQKVIDAMQSK